MKKFFVTALAIILTVLEIPAVRTFATDKTLNEIPVPSFYDSGSCKAYCKTEYERKSEMYKLYYINQNGKKLICKTKNEISDYCVSGNGLTAYYAVENKVYKYSLNDNSVKKIFEADKKDYEKCGYSITSSENGEYCLLGWRLYDNPYDIKELYTTICHGENSVTVKSIGYKNYTDLTFTNNGSAVWLSKHSIYDEYTTYLSSFDYSTGVSKRFAEIEGEYSIEYFSNMYILYNSNKLYKGKIGSEPKLVYSGKLGQFMDCDSKGNTALFSDEKYIYRIDLNSGKRFNITKNSYDSDYIYDYFIYSSDFNSVAYIDCEAKKPVRLSQWNAKSNSYIQRTEVDITGNKTEYFGGYSNDLNVIFINSLNDDNAEIITPLIFENGKFRKIADITEFDFGDFYCDKFGNLIGCDENNDLYIITPDGSRKLIFSGEIEIFYSINDFVMFYCCKDKKYDKYGYETGGTMDIYYIDKNGKLIIFEENTEYDIFAVYD